MHRSLDTPAHAYAHAQARGHTHTNTAVRQEWPYAYTHTKHDIETSGDYITIRGTSLEGLLCAEGVLEV